MGKVRLNGRVAADGAQVTAQKGRLPARPQLFAQLALDLVRMGQYLVQTAVLGDQFQGGLFADARNAGNVVAAVAHQALHVRHLIRPVAVMLLHALCVQKQAFRNARLGQDNAGVSACQLQAVPVAGEHIGRIALLVGQPRRRAQQVVGLVALHFKRGDMHGLERLPHQG